jgi:hypothetical protein
MQKNAIDYYQIAPSVTIKQNKDSIIFEIKNGQSLNINNKEKRRTLEILCKRGKVETNDKTSEGKPVDIDLLNELVNKGFLEPCLDLFS